MIRTYANHLRYFNNPWRVTYGKCDQNVMTWRNECIRAAKLIRESNKEDIKVHFSGGIDSEIVARSFLLANIPFSVVICRHDNNKNLHDIKYAIKFCEENNVDYKFVDLDRDWFINEGCIPYIKKYKTSTISIPQYFYTFERTGGCPVLGLGDIYLHKNYGRYYISEFKHIFSIFEYLNMNNMEGIPYFFKYTPELIISFLNIDIVKKWMKDNKNIQDYICNRNIKHEIYASEFPELVKRPKFHGYETVSKYSKKARSLFINKRTNVKCKIFVDELINN